MDSWRRSFNTPLEVRLRVAVMRFPASAFFQYSIGDAKNPDIAELLLSVQLAFQYSIGDALQCTSQHYCRHSTTSFNTPLEMQFIGPALYAAGYVFQYSIGDAQKGRHICPQLAAQRPFNTPLEMPQPRRPAVGGGGTLRLSILHWRC